jgi:hypothetical protein
VSIGIAHDGSPVSVIAVFKANRLSDIGSPPHLPRNFRDCAILPSLTVYSSDG